MKIQLPAQGFRPRSYQLGLWNAITSERYRRACLCWPRRHGKDILSLNLMAFMSQKRVGAYYYVMPFQNQARRIIWNGIDGSGKRFLHAFPEELWESKREDEMIIKLKNGSMFQVLGGDDPDKLVGSNPVGINFSEFALTNPRCWQLVSPILAENGGWAIFNSTPRGNNHFKKMLDGAQSDPVTWYSEHKTAKDLKVLSAATLRQLRDELKDEALFQQEAFCSFEAPMQGAYFANEMKYLEKEGRTNLDISIDPLLETGTAWDLGMDDATSIWFWQKHRDEYRIVDYYENTGEGLPYYFRYVDDWCRQHNVTMKENYGPHDLAVRELMGDGKSRLEVAREMGFRFRPVKRAAKLDQIEAARNLLRKCYFAKRCEKGVDSLKAYCKEWDSARQTFKNNPLHNWASHAADSFMTMAGGVRRRSTDEKTKRPTAYNTGSYSPS